ncbi:hypothetical protein Cgig2_016982 [Carnegiea gigantea]|uniref:Uncharacterized protein n=1 Tax=Carnegiea gigantea TaxID=171969 RepID=A0A9Q1KIK1_9CARY|nr:hypothetical protein Cgig2_016982 [Carnegiea gigantea]
MIDDIGSCSATELCGKQIFLLLLPCIMEAPIQWEQILLWCVILLTRFLNPCCFCTSQKNPKYPDFKHKDAGEALWIEARYNPSWVKSQLEILDSRMQYVQNQDDNGLFKCLNGERIDGGPIITTYLEGGDPSSFLASETLELLVEEPESSGISGNALLLLAIILVVVDFFSGSLLPGRPNLSSVASRCRSFSYVSDLAIVSESIFFSLKSSLRVC